MAAKGDSVLLFLAANRGEYRNIIGSVEELVQEVVTACFFVKYNESLVYVKVVDATRRVVNPIYVIQKTNTIATLV